MFSTCTPLVAWTERGLYCSKGGFYIDPHRTVDHAIVTHAHSDHARKGSKNYYCESSGLGLLRARLGKHIQASGVPYGEAFILGDVRVSFHSAGHILGSAQVRIQSGADVWVISGDYKRELDPSCEPFEVVPCDTFITEATFGTPKYVWNKNQDYGLQIYNWWKQNSQKGKNSILFGYSLGKAQRILALLAPYAERPVVIYQTITELTECYRREGRRLAPTRDLATFGENEMIQGELILAPPSILKEKLRDQLGEYETAFASGWMAGEVSGRSYGNYRGYDQGFVISDHADWNDINQTIAETGAKRIFVLHRTNGALIRHLRQKGLEAHPVDALTLRKYQSIHEVNLSLF
ncbi:MAG: ligase-associated DNA damage response exonuclease [Bdellovibrionia bacterium]